MAQRSNFSPLNFGLLGLGRHAQRVLLPVFESSETAALVAAGPAASTHTMPIPHSCRLYSSESEVISDSDVQAVYIALPNHLHAPWIAKALEAGKHVLCEKPLCVTADEAEAVHSLLTENAPKLVEGFMYRFHPQHSIVKRLIAEGAVGDIRTIEIHYHYFLDDPDNTRLRPETGGGALLDVGCYGVDAARFLLEQEPLSAAAVSQHSEEFAIDECTTLLMEFPGSVSVTVVCGCRMPRQNSYAVYGSKGVLTAHDAFHCPRNKVPRIELATLDGRSKKIEAPAANHFSLQLDEFVKYVRGESEHASLFGSGLQNMTIIDAARRSANNCDSYYFK